MTPAGPGDQVEPVPGVVVRPARTRDLPVLEALVAVVHEAHVEAEPAHFRPADPGDVRAFLGGLLDDPASAVLVAEVGGRVVGYLWARHEPRPAGLFTAARDDVHVHHVVVDTLVRRTGLASALLADAETWAQARGAAALQLQVWSFNERAVAFFAGRGFVVRTHSMQWSSPQQS